MEEIKRDRYLKQLIDSQQKRLYQSDYRNPQMW